MHAEIVERIAGLKRPLAPWANFLYQTSQRDIIAKILPALLLRFLFSRLLLFQIPLQRPNRIYPGEYGDHNAHDVPYISSVTGQIRN